MATPKKVAQRFTRRFKETAPVRMENVQTKRLAQARKRATAVMGAGGKAAPRQLRNAVSGAAKRVARAGAVRARMK